MRVEIKISVIGDANANPIVVETMGLDLDRRSPDNTTVGSLTPLVSRAIALALQDYREMTEEGCDL